MNEALVQNAEDDIDGQDRGSDQIGLAGERGGYTLAEPSKREVSVAGRASERSIPGWPVSAVAPSETPGARLNESVTDGNPSWWLMLTGASEVSNHDSAESGTIWPELPERT